ncbi:MAG: phospholipase C, phosphocholine-specific [Bacteroidetes bacterium]|nr:phospholipase C, phosphocholine-specific [Bacteroidota bacterium]
MDSRREFLKKAALLSGGTALAQLLPPVIQKALAVNPALGSTFYDAEHIVFLMQENRSFDHSLGMLQGVRGFNDPRAIELPNRNKVWLQSTKEGDVYAPFKLNVKDTKVAWMGSLPHGWSDQTDARNDGKYDKWLEVKKARSKDYSSMPLTLGYCDREDLPFYYSLADAFTVCDQHFCSSITGTHSNRWYWMSGTVREKNEVAAKAHLWNITNYDKPELDWSTYPERLEAQGISWKVYQNELTMGYGLNGEESDWLSNFGTNVLEYYQQYNVRLHPGGIANLKEKKKQLQDQIETLKGSSGTEDGSKRLAAAQKLLAKLEADEQRYTKEAYDGLSAQAKGLNSRAFTINDKDPFFHELSPLSYDDHGTPRKLNIPKGDILHQFRQDVENGTLPTVSWLSAPANFSDHPGEPWFGPWYVSEVMEILLKNPEVWKKTIFVLTYDENDGYFDHVPPFVVPSPYKEHTGKVSAGIDPKMDFVTKEQQTNPSASADRLREATIGLGYRVPMVIASPWTRGGYVNSEVFDHTSSLQFLEHFLEKKFNKKVKEENITEWRRTICGDLTSVFRPYNGEKIESPVFLEKGAFIEGIHQAKFKEAPANYKKLTAEEVAAINRDHWSASYFPKQEKGVRPSNALPYELNVNARWDGSKLGVSFGAGNKVFGAKSLGSPFSVYSVGGFRGETMRTWYYAVKAGDVLNDEWGVGDFDGGKYHMRVYGPNGFYREFIGDARNPMVGVSCGYDAVKGDLVLTLLNKDKKAHGFVVSDNSYKGKGQEKTVAAGGKVSVVVSNAMSFNWYDVSVKVKGYEGYEERFAGKVETGQVTKTDPLMGGLL